ncbi:MAG: carboxypeptidase regulatory-like domain-containing protein [Gammaproteobacteria bacterium]|nr:carboxypeptidase regulatory-like domain-containing protein [Gammaproteobacteria bacterium]
MKTFVKKLLSVCLLGLPTIVWGLEVTGTVTDVHGKPVTEVMVRAKSTQTAPAFVSVFSDKNGAFRFSELPMLAEKVEFEAKAVGWRLRSSSIESAGDDALTLEIELIQTENVAAQVPPSAWLAGMSLDDRGARNAVGSCSGSGCHQFPNEAVKNVIRQLPIATEEVQVPFWRGLIQYMRVMALYFSADTAPRWGLSGKGPDYDALLKADSSLWNADDETMIATNFAAHFANVNFDHYERERFMAIPKGTFGPSSTTEFREFDLHTGGWTRELAIAPGSPYVWVVEDDRDRLGRVDPRTGDVYWFQIPDGGRGPHTINADAAGNLWITLEESFGVARFTPANNKWRVYDKFAQFTLSHDICTDEYHQVRFDEAGGLWLTLLGNNTVGRLDTKTGDVTTYKMPQKEGESDFHVAIYGCVMTSDLNSIWFSQIAGVIGRFDIDAGKVVQSFDMPVGTIPHRMSIDGDDTIYAALVGDGQVWAYNAKHGGEPVRYNLPDRNSAPYSVTWDRTRKALWVATTNNDIMYRLDPKSGEIFDYPMPQPQSYLRAIEIDQTNGDIWTSYANLPVGDGPNYAVQLKP